MLIENLPLVVLALIWIIVAVVQDFRKREVENWWNFSLIAIALAYRAFLSVFTLNAWYFLYGVIGFGIFFALANAFYYSRVFAGGDAKLLMGLGAVLPFSLSVISNLMIFLYFAVLVLFAGGLWGLVFSVWLVVKNKKSFSKEFKKPFNKNKKLINLAVIIAVLFAIFLLFLNQYILIALPILLMLFPLLYVYAKAIEESCMIKAVKTSELTVGDWLYQETRVGNKIIKPNWQGLDEKELALLQKLKKKVKIKQGIPFTPGFLIAFLVLIWLFL